MTKEEYIQKIREWWPVNEGQESSKEVISLCEEAIKKFPSNAALWVMRGDLLQLARLECAAPLSEIENSYRAAIDIDPKYSEAYSELGHFFASVMGNPRKAKQYFKKAKLLCKSKA